MVCRRFEVSINALKNAIMSLKKDPARPAKITPECRYGHGPLSHVLMNDTAGWAFAASNEDGLHYVGLLFQCRTCGYTEFFDDAYIDGINLPPEVY
jgi:hypothetical protein